MVPAELLKAAIDQLSKWDPKAATRLSWVNWRQGYQIKMCWYGGAALNCYLDFKKDSTARDAVLRHLFERHAGPGKKPTMINGHGWTALDHQFSTGEFLSVNEIAEVAKGLGYEFTVLYVQESVSARPAFSLMEIPLVPGETGKEWIDGEIVPYACPLGMNL
ncbi:hypothetical protein H8F21_14210 [Pseudomonas sp. P66]|uniref:Phage protein n=1 Tax=Pseudomonas arcuscaelestis TaxID=2710591 RepID=A0ABS2BYM1_9PSED|nr:hypothetical protein [Pseudomonas arcuscaelestis]